ncbi:MAG: polymer-forming cytoskeletal protein [Bacteroidales bacterium]|nr:polymer-forming cytoskeletal protein [Bacteroidales bacterium]
MAKEVIVTTGIAYSILAPGTSITGNIYSEEDIRIEGFLEGDLTCRGKVILGPQAVLKGNVICVNAEIAGNLEGDIATSEQLSLREKAQIKGAIKTSNLVIEPGARFNGSCEMCTE